MGLQRISITNSARPVYSFIMDAQEHENADKTAINFPGFVYDQPYQRGHVWGEERKKKLIFSLVTGIPIGAVVINDRFANAEKFIERGEQGWCSAVIDGKQRIHAIIDFVNNEFAVPAAWFESRNLDVDENVTDVYFKDLTPGAQSAFKTSTTIPVAEAHVATVEEEKEIFDLINFGGVTQGESDI